MATSRNRHLVITPTNRDEILVKSESDEYSCWITGMTETTPGILVLADYNNCNIKLLDVQEQRVRDTHDLEFSPWDITTISAREVAVTVPSEQHIKFFIVAANLTNSRTSTINTNGKCYGICYHQAKLIVTYRDPGNVEILDMEGEVIRSLFRDASGWFSKPSYVQCYNHCIFVSDEVNNTISTILFGNNTIGSFDLNRPNGIAVLNKWDNLVCSREEDTLYKTDSTFYPYTKLLYVDKPQAICVNRQQNRMYISRGHITLHDLKKNNIILVWNI